MVRMWSLLITGVLILGAAGSAAAQEKKLSRNQVPPSVLATADRETAGATVKGYATELEHGKKVYEVETVLNGRTRDLRIAGDGTLREVEEEVALDSLPASVRSALNEKAKGAKITKVESLTKHGVLVAYEAATWKAGKRGEVQVGPNGKPTAQAQ